VGILCAALPATESAHEDAQDREFRKSMEVA
jgi:hypothetical protein